MKPTIRFPLTSLALANGAVLASAALFFDIHLVKLPVAVLQRISPTLIDDVVVAIAIGIAAFIVDHVLAARRAHQAAELEAKQVRAVRVTMRTVQDIVGNCLNQLQLLRLDADGRVPPESLALFDQVVSETSARLREIGDLQKYGEQQMQIGEPGLDLFGPSDSR